MNVAELLAGLARKRPAKLAPLSAFRGESLDPDRSCGDLNTAEYNADNELVKRESAELEYDKEGNLLSDGANEYSWNARGQLTGISGETSAAFAYDPFGRRIAKTLGSTTTELLYDGANVALEAEEETTTAALLTSLQPDQLFARATAAGTDSYLTDRLGSTVALANGSGEVTTSYAYEPFGASTATGTPSDNPYQFTGRENDATGLQYNRARYYSPEDARFISQDPAGIEGSGTNLYGYAGGDPLDFTDPSGKCFVCVPNPLRPLEEVAHGAKENLEESANQVGNWVSSGPGVLSDVGGFLRLGECNTSFGQRIVNNFVTTNTEVPGLVAPTLSSAVVNRFGGIAAKYGTKTALEWLRHSREFAELPQVARATAVSWLYASVAWEAGVGIGSTVRSGLSELYCDF